MLATFGATFLGVIASFLLWFGGQWWIKQQRDKKALEHMMQEIQEEIQLNITLLLQLAQDIPRELNKEKISHYLPHRMRLAVYYYIVSSGEIRLVPSRRNQRLIRYSAVICENFNKFIDNTEMLLAIFLLKPDGLVLAIHRLEMLAEQAKESANRLQEYLQKLQQVNLPEEDSMDEPKKIDLEDLEAHLTRIEGKLDKSQKFSWSSSFYILGVTAMAVGIGFLLRDPTATWSWVTFVVGFVISIIGIVRLYRSRLFSSK